MSNIIDMTGKQIDYLFVKGRAPDKIDPNTGRHRIAYWCDCACGTKDVYRTGESLRSSHGFHSCGCYSREIARINATTHGDTPKGHLNRLYRIWSLMKDRCNNPATPAYKDYGARGISVCNEWYDYLAFKDWALNNGYDKSLTLDRIDYDGNYLPDNCRWTTKAEQARNRRFCVKYTLNGETHILTDWARIYHINPGTIQYRIKAGWPVEKAITTPVSKRSNNVYFDDGFVVSRPTNQINNALIEGERL